MIWIQTRQVKRWVVLATHTSWCNTVTSFYSLVLQLLYSLHGLLLHYLQVALLQVEVTKLFAEFFLQTLFHLQRWGAKLSNVGCVIQNRFLLLHHLQKLAIRSLDLVWNLEILLSLANRLRCHGLAHLLFWQWVVFDDCCLPWYNMFEFQLAVPVIIILIRIVNILNSQLLPYGFLLPHWFLSVRYRLNLQIKLLLPRRGVLAGLTLATGEVSVTRIDTGHILIVLNHDILSLGFLSDTDSIIDVAFSNSIFKFIWRFQATNSILRHLRSGWELLLRHEWAIGFDDLEMPE